MLHNQGNMECDYQSENTTYTTSARDRVSMLSTMQDTHGWFDKGKRRVGCPYGRSIYAGVFVYADDIKLMAPSTMSGICQKYADEFDVKFNGKKRELIIIYKCPRVRPPDSEIHINNVQVPRKDKVTHLRHYMKTYITLVLTSV